jgi:hypothetical protein
MYSGKIAVPPGGGGIVEGFLSAVDMHHGLKYKKLVGDGDSSVYNKIKNI